MLRILLCLAALGGSCRLHGYSVLTHQAIIDTAWGRHIERQLLNRFPNATPEQLRKAHAHAYGGCLIQDMGYYPFGSKFFSNLVHYVRSGDFIKALIAEAHDLDEYAFALGAMAHYAADTIGHAVAVNPAVAIEYPKLAREFGPWITYAESPPAHLKTEFGFDVLQVARGNYAPEAYHDFVGFEVSKPLLERAFRDTYSLELSDLLVSVDLALGTYRRTVSGLVPAATRAAWVLKKDELVRSRPSLSREKFIFNLSQAAYEKEWGKEYERPGMASRIIAFLFRLVPRFGPFKGLAFQPPTQETARLFMESFNRTLDLYEKLLAEAGGRRLSLVNRDFDTGRPTRRGEDPLADETYTELLHKLAKHDLQSVSPKLRANIIAFFDQPQALAATKRTRKESRDTLATIAHLRDAQRGAGESLSGAGKQ